MGRLRRLVGLGMALVLLAPLLALGPAALLDRGPDGTLRPTLFPIALVALDPFVWDCVRRSLAVAVVVAAGSLVLGMLLAGIVGRVRLRWHPAPAVLVFGGLAVAPFVEALGWRILGAGAWPWFGLCLSHLARGVPLVALAALPALAGISAAGRDAARLAGVRWFRAWIDLTWPLVRPHVAQAVAAVFLLALADPGPPLVLGLRRTLAFQVVEAALGLDTTPRAAILALVTLGFATLARTLLHWWGGAPIAPRSSLAPGAEICKRRGLGGIGALLIVGAWALLVWVPIGALVAEGLRSFPHLLKEPMTRRLVTNSIVVGGLIVALDVLLIRALVGTGRRPHDFHTFLAWPEVVPPLVLAVGALGLVALLDGGSAWGFRGLAEALDPGRTPGVLLVLVLLALRLPVVAGSVGDPPRSDLIDAARLWGARPSRRLEGGVPLGVGLVAFVRAATDLAPALLLAPTIESRTIGPGILFLADQPGDGLGLAAALATVAWLANASARGVSHVGEARHPARTSV